MYLELENFILLGIDLKTTIKLARAYCTYGIIWDPQGSEHFYSLIRIAVHLVSSFIFRKIK